MKKTRITPLDIVIIALLLGLAGYIAYRLTIKLNYKWNWGIIPQYLNTYIIWVRPNRRPKKYERLWSDTSEGRTMLCVAFWRSCRVILSQ